MRKILSTLFLVLLMFFTTSCSDYKNMTGEEIATDILSQAGEAGGAAKSIAWCQGKAISRSGLPNHVIDKIIHFGDPVAGAKKFGYKKLWRELKACVSEYS